MLFLTRGFPISSHRQLPSSRAINFRLELVESECRAVVVIIICSFPFWETQIHFPSLNEKAHQKSGNKLTAAKKRNGWLTKKKQQPSFSTESLFIETTLLGKNANYKFIQIIVWEKNRSQKKDHKKWVEFFTKSF